MTKGEKRRQRKEQTAKDNECLIPRTTKQERKHKKRMDKWVRQYDAPEGPDDC